MSSDNKMVRLAEDKDLFKIYDFLNSKLSNQVLDSSQIRENLSLNKIRNYLFTYDVVFCISLDNDESINELVAFELSPQMFLTNYTKLFYWGYILETPSKVFIKESLKLVKKLSNVRFINMFINRYHSEDSLLSKKGAFSELKLIHISEIKSKNIITDEYIIEINE